MKKLLLSGLIIFCLASFTKTKKTFIPPGTVKINDTLYADETEITNSAWCEYELWTKAKYGTNSAEHKSILPDTTVWRHKSSYNEPYVQYYYRHPAYKDFPLVGISYEQAVKFCEWRTQRVLEKMLASKKTPEVKFEYRLPTKLEWELMALNGSEYFSNSGKNEKGQVMFNHRWAKDSTEWLSDKQRPELDVTAPVFSYWKNPFGLYNLFGNVGEMVREKGISKGGGWGHLYEECRAEKDISYSVPTAWLGFRCVCVIRKNTQL